MSISLGFNVGVPTETSKKMVKENDYLRVCRPINGDQLFTLNINGKEKSFHVKYHNFDEEHSVEFTQYENNPVYLTNEQTQVIHGYFSSNLKLKPLPPLPPFKRR